MRVLLVSQEYPPDTAWGGIGTYAGIVAPAMARAGAEVHVLSVAPGLERRTVVGADGEHVHRAPLVRPRGVGRLTGMPDAWNRVSLASAVSREMRRLDLAPDIVECPEWQAEGLALSRRRDFPLVVRIHSSARQVYRYLGGAVDRDRRLAIRLEEIVIRRADIVTGTRSQLAGVDPSLGLEPGRLREITYPVRPGTRLPMPAGPPRICFAGRFEPRKAPETLVRALPKVRAAIPDARLALVGVDCSGPGEPSWLAWLRRQADELGVADAIDVVERWGSDAVLDELGRSAVCAMPSRWESFGYVAAEAGTTGRPVVASNIPALADVVVDGVTGRLAPPDEPDAWADALIDVLADPQRAAAMGEAGARRMAEECSAERVAGLTLSAYDDAIAVFRAER